MCDLRCLHRTPLTLHERSPSVFSSQETTRVPATFGTFEIVIVFVKCSFTVEHQCRDSEGSIVNGCCCRCVQCGYKCTRLARKNRPASCLLLYRRVFYGIREAALESSEHQRQYTRSREPLDCFAQSFILWKYFCCVCPLIRFALVLTAYNIAWCSEYYFSSEETLICISKTTKVNISCITSLFC